MSTQGIKELWFKGDSGKVFLEEDSLEAREEITLSTSHLLLGAEGNITRVSMEEGGVIIWSMIYTEKGWGRGGRGARGQPVGQGHMRGGPHNRGYAWG